MSQRLILPINKCRVTASYKTPGYQKRFGFTHYGMDMVSFAGKTTVFALGDGAVIETGFDNKLGNVVVARYNSVYNHRTRQTQDIIARCYHMAAIQVRPGEQLTKDSMLGQYGNTGIYSAGAHLHLEFDSNVAAPLASRTLGGSSNIIKAASGDCSIDPVELLHRKAGAPDNQEIRVDTYAFSGMPYADPGYAQIPIL